MLQKMSLATEGLMGQPMFQILSQIKEMERKGLDIVHFEIGDPDFNTPECIKNALFEAVNNNDTHYSASVGDYELRKTICETKFFTPSFVPDIGQVAIAPGANPFIYYLTRCLAEAGDEIIIPDPSFSTYQAVLSFCKVNAIRVPLKEENNFQMLASDVLSKITSKTKMVIVNSPNNPTGAITSKSELKKIAEICLEKGIYLLSDEIYSHLNYSDEIYSPSEIDLCKERVIIVSGFSKAFAMTGWRLGVGIGPQKLMEKIALLIETTVSCTSTIIQKAGIAALKYGIPDLNRMREEYKIRRDYLVDRLNKIDGVKCDIPDGAFYVFPNIQGLHIDGVELANKLLKEAHIGVCPGSFFGKYGEGYIRLCYATSMNKIKEGMDRFENFVERLKHE